MAKKTIHWKIETLILLWWRFTNDTGKFAHNVSSLLLRIYIVLSGPSNEWKFHTEELKPWTTQALGSFPGKSQRNPSQFTKHAQSVYKVNSLFTLNILYVSKRCCQARNGWQAGVGPLGERECNRCTMRAWLAILATNWGWHLNHGIMAF